MRRLMWAGAIVLALISLMGMVGCGRFSKEEAIIIAHNHGNDQMAAIIDGTQIAQLAPNSVQNNEIIILVGRNRSGSYGYGPSQVDKLVQISVVFKNLRTQRLSRETYCSAGAKVKTLIVFQPQSGGDGYAQCTTLHTTGSSKEELERAIVQAENEMAQVMRGGS